MKNSIQSDGVSRACLMRRVFARSIAFLAFGILLPGVAIAQTGTSANQKATGGSDSNPAVTARSAVTDAFKKDEVDRRIEQAIKFLLSQQKEKTGAIADKGHETTMSALAIMALASTGTQPVDPTPEGKAMKRALEFVLNDDRVDKDGYFGRNDGSRMYGHGIVTLMLTEMLGMGVSDEQDKQIHDRCQKAIDIILSSQKVKKATHYRGGWRYQPGSVDSDLSVSVWQLMALRSAHNDGLKVPSAAIDEAVEYLKRSFTRKRRSSRSKNKEVGGFSYEPQQNHSTFTMTAAGLLAMQVCGEYESDQVELAADFLLAHELKWSERFGSYGIYYYAQGMYQRGGEHAQQAEKRVRELLLKEQAKDGSWTSGNSSEKNVGKVYATAMAVLSLSVKYHYLPIYQK